MRDPEGESSWIALDGFYQWEQPTPPGVKRLSLRRRSLYYMLSSYIVRRKDLPMLQQWAAEQHWFGRWMPESHESHEVFLGEFFWAPAFSSRFHPYYGRKDWTTGGRANIPVDVLVATDAYSWESGGFDCSLDDTVYIRLPSRFLARGLNTSRMSVEGQWIDASREVVAVDPSTANTGPSVLLVRKNALLSFLADQELSILWTVLGEKRALGGARWESEHHGVLEVSGAYVLEDGAIAGATHSRFISPGDAR